MLQTQSVMELINRMGSEIKAESIAHVLVLLCEQGRIQEAITVLNEVGNSVTSKPLTSSHATDLDVGLYMVGKIDGLVESHENFIEESLFYDFHDQYSIIASLYSKGEIQKADKIAKEMLSNLEKSC
nr:TPA_asm: hypothetical protein HUJ06_004257 [Nelumbo nucifera]